MSTIEAHKQGKLYISRMAFKQSRLFYDVLYAKVKVGL